MSHSLGRKLCCERLEDRRLLAAVGSADDVKLDDLDRDVDAAGTSSDLHPGSVHGRIVSDLNDNGEPDFGEPGIAGVVVYSDLNFDGIPQDFEPQTRSMDDNPLTDFDETGHYWLEHLQPGFHMIRQVVPAGFEQTFPTLLPGHLPPPWGDATAHVVFVPSGGTVEGIHFGNHQPVRSASIHGAKWQDANGNRERDPGEPGLAGVVVYADLNRNGRLDSHEPQTVTQGDDPTTSRDETGLYALENLEAGEYLIREVVPDGYRQTFPVADPNDAPPRGSDSVDDQFAEIRPDVIDIQLGAGEVLVTEVAMTVHPAIFVAIEVYVVAPTADIPVINLSGVKINGGSGDTSVFQVLLIGDGSSHEFNLQLVNPTTNELYGTVPVIINSAAGNGAHFVELSPGQAVDGIHFGNRPLGRGSVHGRKWEDQNGNREHDPNEPGLAGVTIYSDLNHNGVLDPDEPHTVTMDDDPVTDFDETGLYWLRRLHAGQHVIREVVPDGFIQTYPEQLFPPVDPGIPSTILPPIPIPGFHQVFVVPGQAIDGVDFGNQRRTPGMVSGMKWEDLNGNGQRDDNEPGIAGVRIYSDLDFNGRWDRGEPSTRTREDDPDTDVNEAGAYVLEHLHPGDHFIREVIPDRFVQTYPGSPFFDSLVPGNGFHQVFLAPGGRVDRIDFGNQEVVRGQIHGVKWEDLNGNAQRDAGEPGIAGVTIYSDLNSNGVLDAGEPFTITMDDPREAILNDTGKYWLRNLEPGVHLIREIVPDGYQQTYPYPVVIAGDVDASIFPLPPGGTHQVIVRNGEVVEGVDFGNQRISPASVHGVKWLDRNANGQRDFDEPGLGGVTIYSDLNFNGVLDNNEPRTTSRHDDPFTDFNESGLYGLTNLRPGVHLIREVVPEGFEPTFPLDDTLIGPPGAGGHFVTLVAGQGVDGIDFGNRPTMPATVLGNVWLDSNGNGQRDADEMGQPGVTVYSDLNFNGMLDGNEPSTVTIEQGPFFFETAGDYQLGGLLPGIHVIRIVVPVGATQTYPLSLLPATPNADAHVVVLASSSIVDGRDFGIRRVSADGISLPGDFDRDGAVTDNDYRLWKSTYGSQSNLLADANGDGVVSTADYTVLRDTMGETAVAAATSSSVGDEVAAQVTRAPFNVVETVALEPPIGRHIRTIRDEAIGESDFTSTRSAALLRRLDLAAALAGRELRQREPAHERFDDDPFEPDDVVQRASASSSLSVHDDAWASW